MFKFFNKAKFVYKVEGMNCSSCAALMEDELDSHGIKAKLSYSKSTLEMDDGSTPTVKKVKKILKNLGYNLITDN